jgi:hypothetical protein
LRGLKHSLLTATPHQNRPVRNKRCVVELMLMADLGVPDIFKGHHSGEESVNVRNFYVRLLHV